MLRATGEDVRATNERTQAKRRSICLNWITASGQLSGTDLECVFPAIDRVLGSGGLVHVPVEVKLNELERVVSQGGPFDDGNAVSAHVLVVERESDCMTVVGDRESVTRDALVVVLERDGQRFIILDF